jgi:hypothetical protein
MLESAALACVRRSLMDYVRPYALTLLVGSWNASINTLQPSLCDEAEIQRHMLRTVDSVVEPLTYLPKVGR